MGTGTHVILHFFSPPTEWWTRASAADLYHVSYPRIPQSLWDHIPRALRPDLRAGVAWHQYHASHGVCHLRGQLTMPPTTHKRRPHHPQQCQLGTQSYAHVVQPNPTDTILRKQVGHTGPWERAP